MRSISLQKQVSLRGKIGPPRDHEGNLSSLLLLLARSRASGGMLSQPC